VRVVSVCVVLCNSKKNQFCFLLMSRQNRGIEFYRGEIRCAQLSGT
jgi:hypothetical protein